MTRKRLIQSVCCAKRIDPERLEIDVQCAVDDSTIYQCIDIRRYQLSAV